MERPPGAAMRFSLVVPALCALALQAQPTEGLVVSGTLKEGVWSLGPAYVSPMPGQAPKEDKGPYTLEGLNAKGAVIFKQPFRTAKAMDAPVPSEGFTIRVDLSREQSRKLRTLRVLDGDKETARRDSTKRLARLKATAKRTPDGRVRLTWNHTALPWIMVRLPESNQVIAFADKGEIHLPTEANTLELVASDGVRCRRTHLKVQ